MLIDCSDEYQRQIKIPWTKKLQGYHIKKSGLFISAALLILASVLTRLFFSGLHYKPK